MKRWFSKGILLLMLLSFCACGNNENMEQELKDTQRKVEDMQTGVEEKEVKDIEIKENNVETQVKDTEIKEDDAKTEVKETEIKEDDVDTEVEEIEIEEMKNEKITSMEITTINPYFTQGNQKIWYKAIFCFSEDLPENETISFHYLKNIGEGQLFELIIDSEEEILSKYESRFRLGYFYVTEDKIICLRDYMENDKFIYLNDIVIEDISEELLTSYGTVVFQTIAKEDILGEEEQGWHEWIEVEGDFVRYRSYGNEVESGFYERFVWEKGKGLVEYVSGFGAARDGIDLVLKEDVVGEN